MMEAVKISIAETEEKCKLSDESTNELANLKSHFEDEKSVMMEAVKISIAETEEKCKLLDESQTELTSLKAHFDNEKSELMEANKKIVNLQRQLNSCTDDLKSLTDQSCIQKELLLKLSNEKEELVQSAASARQQAKALAIEQSAAFATGCKTCERGSSI